MMKRLSLMLTLTLLIPVAAILADANDPSVVEDEAAEQPALDPNGIEELLLSVWANEQVQTFQGQLPFRAPAEHSKPCLASDPGLCGFGERLVRARPCLAVGDCPAYQTWKQVMGEPGVRPAPESEMRAVVLTVPSSESPSLELPADVQPPETDGQD